MTKKKKVSRVHRRTRSLSAVDRLRTKIWVSEIENIAIKIIKREKITLPHVPKHFIFVDFFGTNLSRVKGGLSLPSDVMLSKIRDGYRFDNLNKRPFLQTKSLYEEGPDGFPLWKVLERDTKLCKSLVDEEMGKLTGTLADDGSSFEQTVKTIFQHRLPDGIDPVATWELITKERTREIYFDFNVIASSVMDAEEIPGRTLLRISENCATNPAWVITLSAGQIVNTIALYVLSTARNELVPQCYYMLVGVLHNAIQEQLSHGQAIADFLMSTDEWIYKGLAEDPND